MVLLGTPIMAGVLLVLGLLYCYAHRTVGFNSIFYRIAPLYMPFKLLKDLFCKVLKIDLHDRPILEKEHYWLQPIFRYFEPVQQR